MIRGLSAQEILSIWEVAQHQHPVELALTILSMVLPELSPDELLHLSIGRRDAYLLAVREKTFGSRFASYAECPHCDERLEFSFNVADIQAQDTPDCEQQHVEQSTSIEGYELRFRLPNSLDLAAIAHCRNITVAHTLLLQRCIQHIEHDGMVIPLEDVPEVVISGLAKSMTHCDPLAEVLFNLSCPACKQEWSILFDVLSFLWTEISIQAKRLLLEVHTLARAYGWHETEILSLSVTRRQFYLEMVT
jgi:hypothetical protein